MSGKVTFKPLHDGEEFTLCPRGRQLLASANDAMEELFGLVEGYNPWEVAGLIGEQAQTYAARVVHHARNAQLNKKKTLTGL